MSKENNIEFTEEPQVAPKQSIGAALIAARTAKGLTTAEVATALKLQEEYIVALEEEHFSLLPAAPYGRVYLKTLSDFLGADTSVLLDLYANGAGVDLFGDDRESRDTIAISVQEEKPKNHWAFGLLVLIFVVVLVLLVRQKDPVPEVSAVVTDSLEVAGEVQDTTMDIPLLEGELIESASSVEADSVKVSGTWDVDITVVKDSTWVHIIEDGKTIKNGFMQASEVLHLTVNDSVNMKIGKIQNISVKRDGKKLAVAGYNMKAIRITENKVQVIPGRTWDSTFE